MHPDAINLLQKMLEKDPTKRATAVSLIEDAWLTSDRPIDLFVCSAPEVAIDELSMDITSQVAWKNSLESLSECSSEESSCSITSVSSNSVFREKRGASLRKMLLHGNF